MIIIHIAQQSTVSKCYCFSLLVISRPVQGESRELQVKDTQRAGWSERAGVFVLYSVRV